MHRTSRALALAITASSLLAPAAFSQDTAESLPPTSSDMNDSTQTMPDASEPSSQDEAASTTEQSSANAAPASVDPAAAPLDDQKIEQFANAYMEVQTIQQKAESELQTAADPAAADNVRTSAETDMIAAVERSGLQVQEFNQIVQSMASDVEVRNRVAAKLQERSGG